MRDGERDGRPGATEPAGRGAHLPARRHRHPRQRNEVDSRVHRRLQAPRRKATRLSLRSGPRARSTLKASKAAGETWPGHSAPSPGSKPSSALRRPVRGRRPRIAELGRMVDARARPFRGRARLPGPRPQMHAARQPVAALGRPRLAFHRGGAHAPSRGRADRWRHVQLLHGTQPQASAAATSSISSASPPRPSSMRATTASSSRPWGALPAIAASARALLRVTRPYAAGPSAIGMRDNPYGEAPMKNPQGNIRQAMNFNDPRQRGLLGAAYGRSAISRASRKVAQAPRSISVAPPARLAWCSRRLPCRIRTSTSLAASSLPTMCCARSAVWRIGR